MAARSDAAATPGPKNGVSMSVSLVSSSSNCLTLLKHQKTNTRKHIYDRQSLLDIDNVYKHQLSPATTEKLQGLCLLLKPDPETAASPTDATRTKRRRRRCERGQKRGKRGGIRARLRANPTSPAIPSLMLSNVRSLENKLFTLLTHDCTAKFSSNHIIKFADDTSVVGLISNNDETHYREEVAQLAEWCGANNLSLNVEKTKEVVMDFRRNPVDHPPLTIDTSTVERVSSTKFLGVHITEDLTWTTNTKSISKKAQQRLHFLHRLKRASLPPPILTTFYRGTIESVLTSCITVWYGNCCAADRKTLQRTVNTAAKIIGAPLPSILDIFLTRCSSKAKSIVEDPTHPSHSLFQLLPSGRRYRSIRARSARLLNSFFPQAVRALNSHHTAPL